MMEYIEREAALRVLCDACGNAACPKGLIPRCSYYEKMQSIPAADVVPMSWVREHMSGDYISREQAVENAIDQMRHSKSETAMRERLLNMVAADVRPVKRGRWIEHYEPYSTGEEWIEAQYGYECSICGRWEYEKEPFCNCGAMMEES